MHKIVRTWDNFWFSRFDPLSLGVFRIAFGILMLAFYLCLYVNWDEYFATLGNIYLSETNASIANYFTINIFQWTKEFVSNRFLWWVGLFSTLAFTVGWHTRLFTIILFILQSSIINQNALLINGEDLTFRMFLLYGMFAPLGHSLSIDHYLREKKRNKNEQNNPQWPFIWAVRSLQINFILIYVISLPNKLADDVAWLNGNAIYLSMVNTMWSRGYWPELSYILDGLFSKIGTYITIIIEGTCPFLVWNKKTRMFGIMVLAFLHLNIAIVLNGIAFFSLSMVCALITFIPPEHFRKMKFIKRLNLECD